MKSKQLFSFMRDEIIFKNIFYTFILFSNFNFPKTQINEAFIDWHRPGAWSWMWNREETWSIKESGLYYGSILVNKDLQIDSIDEIEANLHSNAFTYSEYKL